MTVTGRELLNSRGIILLLNHVITVTCRLLTLLSGGSSSLSSICVVLDVFSNGIRSRSVFEIFHVQQVFHELEVL